MRKCADCGEVLPPRSGRGPARRYCDAVCRSKAARARARQRAAHLAKQEATLELLALCRALAERRYSDVAPLVLGSGAPPGQLLDAALELVDALTARLVPAGTDLEAGAANAAEVLARVQGRAITSVLASAARR
jgi:hypothetical protein